MKNIIIKSDVKTYFANPETGANIGLATYGNQIITRFDLAGFTEEWGDPAPEVIDIIDIGYHWVPRDNPKAPEKYEGPLWHRRRDQAA